MRLVTRESSKNVPRHELESLVTPASLDSMSVHPRQHVALLHHLVLRHVDERDEEPGGEEGRRAGVDVHS